jgi:hypothetical protein
MYSRRLREDEDAAQAKRNKDMNEHMRVLLDSMSTEQQDRYNFVLSTRIDPKASAAFQHPNLHLQPAQYQVCTLSLCTPSVCTPPLRTSCAGTLFVPTRLQFIRWPTREGGKLGGEVTVKGEHPNIPRGRHGRMHAGLGVGGRVHMALSHVPLGKESICLLFGTRNGALEICVLCVWIPRLAPERELRCLHQNESFAACTRTRASLLAPE